MEKTNFEKYLLCEQHFGSKAKKSAIKTVEGFLSACKRKSLVSIKDNLEHFERVSNFDEIGDAIKEEMEKLNTEYIDKLTEFLNSKKWEE